MLSVWHVVSQEELKFARPAVVLSSRAGVGVPRTGRRREREKRKRRKRRMDIGCIFFEGFFFPRLALVVVVRGGRCVMRLARKTKVFEGMEGKDRKDGKDERTPTARKKGYREEGIEQRLDGTAAQVLCG